MPNYWISFANKYDYPLKNTNYDIFKWECFNQSFFFETNENILLNDCDFPLPYFEEVFYFTHKISKIQLYTKGIYEDKFQHYEVEIYSNKQNKTLEKVLVPTSFQLKEVVERLLKKYEDWEEPESTKQS